MLLQPYFLGCPIWANKEWTGEFFTKGARPKDFLQQYSSAFNSVEGNTTFYGLPSRAIVERWQRETPEGFHFFFKFPRTITHEKCMRHVNRETMYFFQLFEALEGRLGPFFLQLPAAFGARDIPLLKSYLEQLPSDFEYAVEVRHPEFFLGGRAEQELNQLLESFDASRVMFDARPLHRAKNPTKATLDAQRKKPLLPVRPVLTGFHPTIRYIAHPELSENERALREWAKSVAEWMVKGATPYVFIHTPDNLYAPLLSRKFHSYLQDIVELSDFPLWPCETEASHDHEQLLLFS